MFNLYLCDDSLVGATPTVLEDSLKELAKIVSASDGLDKFWKHEEILNTIISGGITFGDIIYSQLADKQFMYQILPKIMHELNDTDNKYSIIEDFDRDYIIFNAFYGINLPATYRHCTTNQQYISFRDRCIRNDLSPQNFTNIKDQFFDKLVFHIPAIKQIEGIKDPDLFIDIIAYLLNINKSVSEFWENGNYNYSKANHKYNMLRMSMESTQTMDNPRLRKMREFTFSDNVKRCCELHAKISLNAFRIHIFPENERIYVGYIGPHLETSEPY